MKKFVPVSDLSSMDQSQRDAYYNAACEYFGIPAELQLLQMIWMDAGDSGRKLVLYALKGATDMLRANRGISITKLTKDEGDGYIAYMAEGVDKTGRTEIAVGAANTRNLTGKALCDSVMTAQTRATRRLTLQFVGGGLLDESEVSGQVSTPLASQATPLSQLALAQPTSQPSAAAGKDITPVVPVTMIVLNPETGRHRLEIESGQPLPPGEHTVQITDVRVETAAQSPKEVGESFAVDAPGGTPSFMEQVEPKRRRRRTKAEMEAARSQQSAADILPMPEIPAEAIAFVNETIKAAEVLTGVTAPADAFVTSTIVVPADKMPAPLPVVEVQIDQPTAEQLDVFKKRLFRYKNDVLEPAGLIASEGTSIHEKIKRYARNMFPAVDDFKRLTVTQWESFFQSIDDGVKTLGPGGFVNQLNDSIGIKE